MQDLAEFFQPCLMIDHRVRSFPIGPRDLFLVKDEQMAGITASNRPQAMGIYGHSLVLRFSYMRSLIFSEVFPRVFMVEKVWYRLAFRRLSTATNAERVRSRT